MHLAEAEKYSMPKQGVMWPRPRDPERRRDGGGERNVTGRNPPAARGDIGLAVAGLQGKGWHGADVRPEPRQQTGLNLVEELSQDEQVNAVPTPLVLLVVQWHVRPCLRRIRPGVSAKSRQWAKD